MILFTESKAKVRELNLKAMQECLKKIDGGWAYFGLPSPKMEDVLCWKTYLRSVDAVERGSPGIEWKSEHQLMLTAMLHGVKGFTPHMGDIDEIIISNKSLCWEFDVVNLDYTGGITYKDAEKHSKRVEALRSLIQKQGQQKKQFFLSITVNDRHHDGGEIKTVLTEMINRTTHPESIEILNAAIANEDRRQAAVFYTYYIVLGTGQQWFKIESFRPIFYTGKREYRMLNLTFCFKPVAGRDAPANLGHDIDKICALKPLSLQTGAN